MVYSVYVSIALLLALGLITAIITSVAIGRHWGTLLFPLILTLLLVGGAVGVIFLGRDLSHAGLATVIAIMEPSGLGRWINRGFIALILVLSIGVIVGQLVNRKRAPIHGHSLFIGFLLYYLTMSLLPSVFGTEPAFLHHQLYPLIVMVAVFFSDRMTPDNFNVFVKWLLSIFMLASLLAAAVMPSLAVQANYRGWIPGFDYRLWGLASHANLLGPAALTLLLLEYMQPTRNRLLRTILLVSGLTVLVWSQSKTVWATALLVMGFLTAYRNAPAIGRVLREGGQVALPTVLYLGGTLLGLLAMLAALLFMGGDRLLDNIMASDIGVGLATMSGRDIIWATALQEWENNWLFGYGPLVWGDLYRFQQGMFSYAFHAHNQVLQTVSMGGGFALLGLLVYVWLLFRYSVRAAVATNGVSVAMLLIVIVRSVTEVPLPQHALFSVDFLLHIVMFMILVLYGSPVSSHEKTFVWMPRYPLRADVMPRSSALRAVPQNGEV